MIYSLLFKKEIPDVLIEESDLKCCLPEDVEGTVVLVGEMRDLEKRVISFIRLSQGCHLGNLMEVAIPVRFLFIVIGPPVETNEYFEIGRSLATFMADEVSIYFFDILVMIEKKTFEIV